MQADIPEISADLITSGEIGSDQLAECSVTGPKICDYATCLMQEDNPGRAISSVNSGTPRLLHSFVFTPEVQVLKTFGSLWASGRCKPTTSAGAAPTTLTTDTLVSLTAIGVSEGLTAGQSFPPPSDALSGIYFICQVAGNNCVQPNINNINHTAGDWALCLDGTQGWVHIDANAGWQRRWRWRWSAVP